MKTIPSVFFAILAIVVAVYNNEYMLSRITTRLSKHITPITSALFGTTATNNMSSDNTTAMFRGLPVIPDEPLTTEDPRKIAKSFLAIEQSEGAGARVRRSVGTPKLRNFSPFLMLDHFAIPPGAGFPDRKYIGVVLWYDAERPLTRYLKTPIVAKRPSPTFSLAPSTTKTSPGTRGRLKLVTSSS
jgi:hypothetical protein